MALFSVIITAGGIGRRMNSELPKQFLLMRGKPMLMKTMERFYQYNPENQIILTLPEEWKFYWEELLIKHEFRIPHRVVTGGAERYHSVKNALKYCHHDYVAIHDGVRPMVSVDTLKKCFEKAYGKDGVIPVIPLKDSVRQKTEKGTVAVNRSDYLLVQTPQCFKKDVLLEAYERPFHEGITDDASLVEAAGFKVATVDGNTENIKITTQFDLRYAEVFFNS